MFVGHEIARYYETLRLQSPSIVVVIGPNHFDQGKSAIQMTDRGYETPYGTLQIALDGVQYLRRKGIATVEPATFDNEQTDPGMGLLCIWVGLSSDDDIVRENAVGNERLGAV